MGRAVAGGSGARGAGTAAGPMAHFDHPPLAHGGARSEGVVARYSGSAQTVASRRAPPRRFRPVATAVRSADYVCDTPPTACAISAWVCTRTRDRGGTLLPCTGRRRMDVIVTRAAHCRKAWTLADLLGRPMGHIMEARGPGFTIFPAERVHHVLGKMSFGPFASLDDALW